MDIVEFALFKFKNIEGVLKGWKASEFDISKYYYQGVSANINYDIKNDKAELFIADRLIEICNIKDLPEVLKNNGLYEKI